MKIPTLIISCLTLFSFCASCSKAGYEELKGQWIEQTLDTTVYENGKKIHFLSYNEFDFKEDCVIRSFVVEQDGECVFEITCQGSWDYIKGPFSSGTRKEAMIEIVYDMDTFTVEYDELQDPSLIENLREKLVENNEIVERVSKENDNRHYGYSIVEIHPNYIEMESNDSDFLFWTRSEAYKKYGVGGGELEILCLEDDEEIMSDSQSILPPKKEFLNEAGSEYYECAFTDDAPDRAFYLALIPEIGTGVYQAPSGNIYYLQIEEENDTRTQFFCTATDSEGNSTKLTFYANMEQYPDINGTMVGTDGNSVFDFTGSIREISE